MQTLRRLREHPRRDPERRILLDGPLLIGEALDAGIVVEAALVAADPRQHRLAPLVERLRASGAEVREADPQVVQAGDAGTTLHSAHLENNAYAKALHALAAAVIERCSPSVEAPTRKPDLKHTKEISAMTKDVLRIAVPTADGMLCNHFGHCEKFVLLDVHGAEIQNRTEVTPPPHEPGVLPRWLADQGVQMVIAGGMGQRAISLFEERGIRVLTGAPPEEPQSLVRRYLEGTLVCGANVCDH